jgi:hypothetical protein
MKLFTTKFYQTLIFNVATIAAIVVGTFQFLVRAYKENNGNEKVRKVIQTILQFVDTLVEQGKVYFAEPETAPVPVAKVSTKRTKRA